MNYICSPSFYNLCMGEVYFYHRSNLVRNLQRCHLMIVLLCGISINTNLETIHAPTFFCFFFLKTETNIFFPISVFNEFISHASNNRLWNSMGSYHLKISEFVWTWGLQLYVFKYDFVYVRCLILFANQPLVAISWLLIVCCLLFNHIRSVVFHCLDLNLPPCRV